MRKKIVPKNNYAFKPFILRIWMHALHVNAEVSAIKLIRYLKNKLTKAEAQKQLDTAIANGILIQTKNKLLKLPSRVQDAPAQPHHDLYCYECHLPGNLLNCPRCIRSFHALCRRKKPERPNYTVPSDKLQKNKFPAFNSDSSEDDNERESRAQAQTNLLQTTASRQTPELAADENNSSLDSISLTGHEWTPKRDTTDGKPCVEELESKDVIFVNEVPAPRRRHEAQSNNSNYKCENIDEHSEDSVNEMELCTACRLMKRNHTPPKCSSAELNYLIKLTFQNSSSWLVTDVSRYMRASDWSALNVSIIKRILFKCRILEIDEISIRITNNEYNSLAEFLVDLLDLQHNIGVFFGADTPELDASKWLLRDIQHDLKEIRLCPDCFRYSNESNQPFWFSKPCFTRHELVYAKARGFPYWPAKVIRVHAKTGKYDVRFFGGKHTRALIAARDILPIDTDEATLKLRRTPKLAEAIRELNYLQHLFSYPFSYFDYNSSPEMANSAINNVLQNFMPADTTATPAAPRSAKKRARNDFDGLSPLVLVQRLPDYMFPNRKYRRIASMGALSVATGTLPDKNTTLCSPTRATRSAEAARTFTWTEYNELKKKLEQNKRDLAAKTRANEKQEIVLRKLKQQLVREEEEKQRIKRQQWCYKCLKVAKFSCCFKASYCSKDCQLADWIADHYKICQKRREDQNEPSSTT